MQPVEFLDSVSGYVRNGSQSSADRPIKLARIDPAYSPFASPYPDSVPPARVTFEGETTLSGKAYPVAPGYIPDSNARVVMVPIGTTYLISGGAAQYAAQGFYWLESGISGIEFGDGNYFDTNAGLVLYTDAYVAGDTTLDGSVTYGPRNVLLPEFRKGTVTMSTASNVSSIATSITFSPAFPTGSSLVVPGPNINAIATNTAGVIARAHNISITGMTITLLQADAARSPQIPGGFSASVHWFVMGDAPAGT